MILHIWQNIKDYSTFQEHLKKGDGLLLLQDAVYITKKIEQIKSLSDNGIFTYILDSHAEARNIKKYISDTSIINYEQFLDMVITSDKIISW